MPGFSGKPAIRPILSVHSCMGLSRLTWKHTCLVDDAKKQLFVYEHDAGRLELLIRIVYWILIGIVAGVYGFIAGICLFIQWFYILVLGRRNEGLSNFAKGYLEYLVYVMGYTNLMTDRRPNIMPVPVKIFEEL